MSFKSNYQYIGGRILRLIPASIVLPVISGINKGAKWVRGAANCPELLGTYESELQERVASIIKPGMIVYDIGANVGFWTLAFSRLVGAAGRVIAFEPVPSNIEKLLQHLNLNNISNTMTISAAIGKTAGIKSFAFGNDSFTGRLDDTSEGQFCVSVFSLDDLIFNMGVIPKPDFIKMDIEGGEFEALMGMETLLKTTSASMIVSLHGKEQQQKCCQFLTEGGYCFNWLGDHEAVNTEIYVYKKPTET